VQCDQVSAIGKVLLIEKTYGTYILDNTFSFVVKVCPGNGYALKGIVMDGVAVFLHRHLRNENFSLSYAKKKLSLLNTELVLAKARDKSKLYGSGVQFNIADQLVESYNKGLSAAKKLYLEGSSDK
jgi:hypothetical protein